MAFPDPGVSPDGAAMASGKPKASRKLPRMVDWRLGARLLAAGEPPEAVAAALNIDRDRFWEHLAKSTRFQRHIVTASRLRQELGDLLRTADLVGKG